MDYQALREKPRQFLALTSLEVAEFDELLTDFARPENAVTAGTHWRATDGSSPPIVSVPTPCCRAAA